MKLEKKVLNKFSGKWTTEEGKAGPFLFYSVNVPWKLTSVSIETSDLLSFTLSVKVSMSWGLCFKSSAVTGAEERLSLLGNRADSISIGFSTVKGNVNVKLSPE